MYMLRKAISTSRVQVLDTENRAREDEYLCCFIAGTSSTCAESRHCFLRGGSILQLHYIIAECDTLPVPVIRKVDVKESLKFRHRLAFTVTCPSNPPFDDRSIEVERCALNP
ncbi:unnamed protein product, partial [Dicrocoelium dendriticum]